MLLKRDMKSYLPKVTIRKWQRQDSNIGVGLRTRASNCPAILPLIHLKKDITSFFSLKEYEAFSMYLNLYLKTVVCEC